MEGVGTPAFGCCIVWITRIDLNAETSTTFILLQSDLADSFCIGISTIFGRIRFRTQPLYAFVCQVFRCSCRRFDLPGLPDFLLFIIGGCINERFTEAMAGVDTLGCFNTDYWLP